MGKLDNEGEGEPEEIEEEQVGDEACVISRGRRNGKNFKLEVQVRELSTFLLLLFDS
jgi:hypothetical protein